MILILALLSCTDSGKPGGGPCEDDTACTPTDTPTDTPTGTPTEPAECPPADTSTETPGVDADGDGWSVERGDCDDTDPSMHPGAKDTPEDGIDQDCDGVDSCVVDSPYDGSVGVDNDRDVEDLIDFCAEGWDAVPNIWVEGTRRLVDLEFLSCVCELTSGSDSVTIIGNEALQSLGGLENLTDIRWLWIESNDLLTDLSALSRLRSMGTFVIADTPVTTLEPFSRVTTWSDEVILEIVPLTDLNGLQGMVEVPSLWVNHVPLRSLTGLENLTTVEGDFNLAGGDLQNLCGLDSLQSAGMLAVVRQSGLTEIGPLSSLRRAGLSVYGNSDLVSFYTPSALEELNGLYLSGPVLGSVAAAPLNGMIDGDLSLYDSPLLTDLTGLAPLTAIGGDLWINGNDSLTSLEGLHNIEWIGGDVEITDNPLLSQAEIDAFLASVGLEDIDGTVTVEDNGD